MSRSSRKFKFSVPKVKPRSAEKVLMDTFTRPKVFRRSKRELLAKEADKEIRDFLRTS